MGKSTDATEMESENRAVHNENTPPVSSEEMGKETMARREFLRCLSWELREKNTAVLAAAASCEESDQETLRHRLEQAATAAQAQLELLGMLDHMLRTL